MSTPYRTKSGLTYSYRRRKRPRYASSDSKMALSIAKKALALSRKTVRNMEKKQSTAAVGNQVVELVGAVTPVGRVLVGDDFFNRDGQKITCTGFDLSYALSTGGNSLDTVRIILFIDKRQEDGVTPAVLDVLQSADPVSMTSEHNLDRFQILFDNFHTITLLAGSKNQALYRFRKRKMNLEQRWDAAAAADIIKNGLYTLVIGSLVANQPNLRITSRIFFTDN